MLKEVRAAGFIIFRRTPSIEYLLLQASYRDRHWTPPKGHLEKGEDDLTAAYREVMEESGIGKDQLKLFENFREELHYNVDDKPKIVTYWLAELIDKDFKVIISNEAQDFRWAKFDEACLLAKFPDMQALLKRADGFLKNCN